MSAILQYHLISIALLFFPVSDNVDWISLVLYQSSLFFLGNISKYYDMRTLSFLYAALTGLISLIKIKNTTAFCRHGLLQFVLLSCLISFHLKYELSDDWRLSGYAWYGYHVTVVVFFPLLRYWCCRYHWKKIEPWLLAHFKDEGTHC